eukprot:6320002-Alexandrium_andersonii.AAC.1
MLLHSDLGRREAAPQVALTERPRPLSGAHLGDPVSLCTGRPPLLGGNSAIVAWPAHRLQP